MDQQNSEFWKREGWKGSFLKLVGVLLLLFILLGFAGYLSSIKAWYFLGIDGYYILAMLFSTLFLFFSFRSKRFMFKDYLRHMGFFNVKSQKVLLSLFITIFALFAILTSFHLRNVSLASAVGEKIFLGQTLFGTFFYLLIQILLVALWEELLFRGYTQNILEAFFSQKIGKYAGIISIFFTSLLFTSFHLASTNELTFSLRFLNVFFGSFVIGFAYYKSRNLWASIFIHGGYNTLDQIVGRFISDRNSFISKIFNGDLINSGVPKEVADAISSRAKDLMGVMG